jgi:hypothetical protein
MTSIRRHGLLSTEQLVRRAVRNNDLSAVDSKPASDGRIKTSHFFLV